VKEIARIAEIIVPGFALKETMVSKDMAGDTNDIIGGRNGVAPATQALDSPSRFAARAYLVSRYLPMHYTKELR
jgi:hypothetical protein